MSQRVITVKDGQDVHLTAPHGHVSVEFDGKKVLIAVHSSTGMEVVCVEVNEKDEKLSGKLEIQRAMGAGDMEMEFPWEEITVLEPEGINCAIRY